VGVGWRGGSCSSLTLSKIYTERFAAECQSACDFLSYRHTQQIRSGGTWLSPASSSLARAHYRGTEDAGKKKQVCAMHWCYCMAG